MLFYLFEIALHIYAEPPLFKVSLGKGIVPLPLIALLAMAKATSMHAMRETKNAYSVVLSSVWAGILCSYSTKPSREESRQEICLGGQRANGILRAILLGIILLICFGNELS